VDKLLKLCGVVTSFTPQAEMRWSASPDDPTQWTIIVMVGDVIVATSSTGPIERSIDEVIRALGSISQRMMQAIRPEDEE